MMNFLLTASEQAESQNYPMSMTVALAVICLLVIAVLWLPSILGKN